MTPTRPASPAQVTGPNVSVVIAAYSSDRWTQLRDAVASVGAQYRPALETIVHFADPAVAGVGGRVDPLWASARPNWFPGEFDWTVGASYSGMPEATAQVRNVWSNNMGLRRAAFDAVGGFREDFGKVGGLSTSMSAWRRTTSPTATTATAELAVAL